MILVRLAILTALGVAFLVLIGDVLEGIGNWAAVVGIAVGLVAVVGAGVWEFWAEEKR